MQGQPENRPPTEQRSKPPQRPKPPSIAPVEQKPSAPGRNWPLFVVGGGIALALLCGVGFLIFALFFRPEVPARLPEPTSTLGVVSFMTPTPTGETSAQPETPTVAEPPATPAPPTPEEVNQPETEPASETSEQASAETNETNETNETTETNPTSPPQINTGPVIMASPDYSIQTFLYWRAEVAERDLQLVNDIKFPWVKQEFPWREIEGAGKGEFNWSNTDRLMDQIDAHGLQVIARLGTQPAWAGGGFPEIGPPDDYQDFIDFVTTLVTRYQGRIDAYQIWNEPNLAREWGNRPPNPTEYTELLRRSYQAIKAVDPNALIITAGLAPTSRWDDVAMPDTVFVQGMYDADAQPYFDALGVHGAGYKVPPDTDPEIVANDPVLHNNDPSPPELKRIYAFRHIEDVRQVMVNNGDVDKRVVVLEFGWTVDPRPDSPYAWHAVTEKEQAAYIVGAYIYAERNWQPWIGVMNLIYLANADWTEDDEQTYWSITEPLYPEFKARPAYWGLLEWSRQR